MTKQTITPGEWVVLTTFEPEITTTTYRIRPHAKTEMEACANAQAIAAVPDMIEALKSILDDSKDRDNDVAVATAALRKAGQIE